jgi:hypothetical protein
MCVKSIESKHQKINFFNNEVIRASKLLGVVDSNAFIDENHI